MTFDALLRSVRSSEISPECLFYRVLKRRVIDDERGPCGSADMSRSERTVSEDEEGPLKSNSIVLEFRQGTQGCDKVNRLRLGD